MISGTVGIVLGVGTAVVIAALAGWPSLVSGPAVVTGLLFSIFTGVIFGFLPANKAVKLDPADCLRDE